ncbi:hypothetical protein SESBI_18374 [Sesbania bispinosa]|nr:hypothetical protein SESBI_18374 [Sesbania bispinosa]
MEPHQTPHVSPNDGPFLYDKLEDPDPETFVAGKGPSTGDVSERALRVRDIFSLPHGEMIIIPFDGSTPSGTDADGLLGGFLGRLAQNYRYFPISFKKWPKVLQSSKDWVWANVIKEICQKNTQNRTKLTINHTSGSKKLKRRMTKLEKISEIERHGTAPVAISPNDSLGQVLEKNIQAGSSNASQQNRVAQLENEVQEMRTELKTRDEKMKKMEALLAHVIANSSIFVPPNLATGLDIQTPPGQTFFSI